MTKVHRIRTEEIVSYLCEFIDTFKKKKYKVDTFLDFICKKQSVSGSEHLCVRIPDLRYGIFILLFLVLKFDMSYLEHCY